MKNKKLISFECEQEGHEDNFMNQVCIDPNCKDRGLICIMCQYEKHQQHKSMPLKIFLYEYKLSIENYKKTQLEAERKKMLKQSSEKEQLAEYQKSIIGIMDNFQSFVNEQIEACKQDLLNSMERKAKKMDEKFEIEDESLIQEIESNQLANGEEAQAHIKKLASKVKGVAKNEQNSLIVQIKGIKHYSDQKNIKQKLNNFKTVSKQVSDSFSMISSTLIKTLSSFKSEQVCTQEPQMQKINGNNNINKYNNKKQSSDYEAMEEEQEEEEQIQIQKENNKLKQKNNEQLIDNLFDSQEEDMLFVKNSSKNKRINRKNNNYLLEDNNNSNKIQEEPDYSSEIQIQQVRKTSREEFKAPQSLQPFYKKQDISITQLEKNQQEEKINNNKSKIGQKSGKVLTRTAQNSNLLDNQKQNALMDNKSSSFKDPFEDLFSSQVDILSTNNNTNGHQSLQNNNRKQHVGLMKEENKQQQNNKSKNSILEEQEDFDEKAYNQMFESSQRNQQNFYKHRQSQMPPNTNMSNDDMGEIRLDIKHKNPIKAHEMIVRDVLFLDASRLATCSFDKLVKIWNVNGQRIANLNQHTQRLQQLAYSQSLKLLASVGKDNSLILWNDKGNNFDIKTQQNNAHKEGIQTVMFIEGDQFVVTGGADKIVKIWAIQKQTLKLVQKMPCKNDICFSLVYNPIRKHVIAGGEQYLQIWKKPEIKATQINKLKPKEVNQCDNQISAHRDYINKIICQIVNNEAVIISASDDCSVKVWNALDYSLLNTIKEEMGVQGICFIDMTGILVLGLWQQSGGGKICFWDISDGNTKLQEVEQINAGTTSIVINHDNSFLVSSHENGKLELFKLTYESD